MNIVLCGFMGCGKTTIGRVLAEITGKKFIDTDEEIEKNEGVSISEIFEKNGENYFRELEYKTCRLLGEADGAVISTGGGAMTFEKNVLAIKENSKIVFLDVPFDVICKRITDSQTRPLFKDKEKAKALYYERKSKYEAAADLVINADCSPLDAASKIAKQFQ